MDARTVLKRDIPFLVRRGGSRSHFMIEVLGKVDEREREGDTKRGNHTRLRTDRQTVLKQWPLC